MEPTWQWEEAVEGRVRVKGGGVEKWGKEEELGDEIKEEDKEEDDW